MRKKSTKTSPDPMVWVDEHGDYLFNFALLRLRDKSIAEDLVQEALLSALAARESFKGESSERTWLTSILKYKIIDYLRRHKREIRLDEDAAETERFFVRDDQWNGHWNKMFAPRRWAATPERALESSEFRMVLADCLMRLPERTANTFTLHEIDGLTCAEIGEVLGVSTNNCWTILHRARLRLRHCIESNWFDE